MWTDQYCALARYNSWANKRIFAVARELDDAARKRDLGAFFGSVEGTLNHILLTDRIWMARFTGDEGSYTSRDRFGVPIGFEGLSQIVYPVFNELCRNRELLDRQIEFWARGLTQDELTANLTYFNTTGRRFRHPFWQVVIHFFNH
jgi:uncharacterized damage-inducible protein DinB